MPSIDVIAGLAFIVTFIAVSIATADTAGLEQRLRRRGSVAESAQAMRHAQDVMDFARGGYLGVVCTPSRRALHLSGDLDVETPTPPEPPRADVVAAVVAVERRSTEPPARPAADARHLVAYRRRPRRRLARGIRALLLARSGITPPGARRASATTRPPGDSR
ncbi:hypothetical protein ACFVAJ_20365 [Agromyces sp. NPDC057679]|uniref:hypothetical protein n=1 Tax=Agromyces sp. NPDC057679 TaxID=3346207 RepID=UPI00366C4ACA